MKHWRNRSAALTMPAGTPPGETRNWLRAVVVTGMVLALVGFPAGFVLEIPWLLGVSFMGLVAGGVTLTA